MPETLIIRADASVAIGTGHVMRCLALAQAWEDAGGRCIFVMAESTPAIGERISAEGFEILTIDSEVGTGTDAQSVKKLARDADAAWVVVDGYRFGAEYQDLIKDGDLNLLFIDDNGHARHYAADLVLNQNIHASSTLYPHCASNTELLLGPRYALLRREFAAWTSSKREIAAVGRKVLVTMGGSDPENVTETVIHALREVAINGLTVKVVVGGSSPHIESIKRVTSQQTSRFELLSSTNCMPELMAWADLAVSAAGSTCWEICLLGLPAIVIPVAENQRAAAVRLDAIGGARLADTESIVDSLTENVTDLLSSYERRRRMSAVSRSLVDGLGSTRVVESLLKPVAHAVGET